MARSTWWQDRLVGLSVANGGQNNADLLLNVSSDESRGLTLTRTILALGMFSTTVAGAYGVQIVDVGIGLIDRDAAAVAAFPDPDAQDDSPPSGWLFRKRCLVAQNGAGAPAIFSCEVDLRAMRKVREGQLTLILNSQSQIGTTFTVAVWGSVRMLLLLP